MRAEKRLKPFFPFDEMPMHPAKAEKLGGIRAH
jgi:hypothetical protein